MKVVNDLFEFVNNINSNINEQEYTYISVRLKPEYYYMLDLIASLNNRGVGSVLTEDITERLFRIAIYLLSASGKDSNLSEDIVLHLKDSNPYFYEKIINKYNMVEELK